MRIALAVALLAFAVPAAAARTPPSGFRVAASVACVVDGGAVRCDVAGKLRPTPPGACASQWRGLSLRASGRARLVCSATTVFSRSLRTLPAGGAWAFANGVSCVARSAAVECLNAARHGFVLGRAAWSRR
jgi:hypothetical protein